jgi:hypothetical protein
MKLLLKRNHHLAKLCTENALEMVDKELRIVRSVDVGE